MTLILHLRSE